MNQLVNEPTRESLEADILRIRRAVRENRDQIGDYRCWVDDDVLYARTFPELERMTAPPPADEFEKICHHFFHCRQRPDDPIPADFPLDSEVAPLVLEYGPELDADLAAKQIGDLRGELALWKEKIYAHHAKGPLGRTDKDDSSLYLSLPEKKEACTRLPPESLFLGRGCPAYNAHCQAHPEDFAQAEWRSAKRQ